jgi:hypothetical protein
MCSVISKQTLAFRLTIERFDCNTNNNQNSAQKSQVTCWKLRINAFEEVWLRIYAILITRVM